MHELTPLIIDRFLCRPLHSPVPSCCSLYCLPLPPSSASRACFSPTCWSQLSRRSARAVKKETPLPKLRPTWRWTRGLQIRALRWRCYRCCRPEWKRWKRCWLPRARHVHSVLGWSYAVIISPPHTRLSHNTTSHLSRTLHYLNTLSGTTHLPVHLTRHIRSYRHYNL